MRIALESDPYRRPISSGIQALNVDTPHHQTSRVLSFVQETLLSYSLKTPNGVDDLLLLYCSVSGLNIAHPLKRVILYRKVYVR